jgi:hypothetical protein
MEYLDRVIYRFNTGGKFVSRIRGTQIDSFLTPDPIKTTDLSTIYPVGGINSIQEKVLEKCLKIDNPKTISLGASHNIDPEMGLFRIFF